MARLLESKPDERRMVCLRIGRKAKEVTGDKQLHGMKTRVMKVLMIATTLINGSFGRVRGKHWCCVSGIFGGTLRFKR